MKLAATFLGAMFLACATTSPRSVAEPSYAPVSEPPQECSQIDCPQWCPMRAPPEEPKVNWLAPGCPPQYLGCLTGEDSAKVMRYLKAIKSWSREVFQRCGHDP